MGALTNVLADSPVSDSDILMKIYLEEAVLLYDSSFSESTLESAIQKIYEKEIESLPLPQKFGIYLNLKYRAIGKSAEAFDFFTGAANYFKERFIVINGGGAYWRPVEGEFNFKEEATVHPGYKKVA